jgi:hypothetical protein
MVTEPAPIGPVPVPAQRFCQGQRRAVPSSRLGPPPPRPPMHIVDILGGVSRPQLCSQPPSSGRSSMADPAPSRGRRQGLAAAARVSRPPPGSRGRRSRRPEPSPPTMPYAYRRHIRVDGLATGLLAVRARLNALPGGSGPDFAPPGPRYASDMHHENISDSGRARSASRGGCGRDRQHGAHGRRVVSRREGEPGRVRP